MHSHAAQCKPSVYSLIIGPLACLSITLRLNNRRAHILLSNIPTFDQTESTRSDSGSCTAPGVKNISVCFISLWKKEKKCQSLVWKDGRQQELSCEWANLCAAWPRLASSGAGFFGAASWTCLQHRRCVDTHRRREKTFLVIWRRELEENPLTRLGEMIPSSEVSSRAAGFQGILSLEFMRIRLAKFPPKCFFVLFCFFSLHAHTVLKIKIFL